MADEIVPNPGPVYFDARFAHTVPWQIGWQLRPGDTLKVQRLAEGSPAGQPMLFTLSGEESQLLLSSSFRSFSFLSAISFSPCALTLCAYVHIRIYAYISSRCQEVFVTLLPKNL